MYTIYIVYTHTHIYNTYYILYTIYNIYNILYIYIVYSIYIHTHTHKPIYLETFLKVNCLTFFCYVKMGKMNRDHSI